MGLGYVLRLIPSRPTLAIDMTDEERTVMGRHAAHWQPEIEAGRMVAFGSVAGDAGTWGLGVLQGASDDAVLELTRSDPAVVAGLGRYEVGQLLQGYVRPAG